MDYIDKHFLESLSYRFPTIGKASTEIINLSAILQLPKETEHFLTDIHGEYEQFAHILKNGSGAIRSKIEEVFGFELSNEDKKELATLIYYPDEKIELVEATGTNMHDWYRTMLPASDPHDAPRFHEVYPLQGAQIHRPGICLHH